MKLSCTDNDSPGRMVGMAMLIAAISPNLRMNNR